MIRHRQSCQVERVAPAGRWHSLRADATDLRPRVAYLSHARRAETPKVLGYILLWSFRASTSCENFRLVPPKNPMVKRKPSFPPPVSLRNFRHRFEASRRYRKINIPRLYVDIIGGVGPRLGACVDNIPLNVRNSIACQLQD